MSNQPIEIHRQDGKIFSPVRNKWLIETPEERVRQEYLCILVNEYGFSPEQVAEEENLSGRGSAQARADHVIWRSPEDKAERKPPLIIVEYKSDNVAISPADYGQGDRYLDRARSGFLGFIHSRYPIEPLKLHLVGTTNGLSIKPTAGRETGKVLKLNALQPSGLEMSAVKGADIPPAAFSRFALKQGDLLICRSVGSYDMVAKCAVVERNAPDTIYPDIMIRARFGGALLPEYVREVMQTPLSRSYFQSNARTAVGMWKIGATDIQEFPIPLPPLEVQESLVSAVSAARVRARALREEAEALKARAAAEIEAAILGQAPALATASAACHNAPSLEPSHEPARPGKTGAAPEVLARSAPGRGEPAGGLSGADSGIHSQFDGVGRRAGGAGAAASTSDSTKPLDATRELATSAGSLTYTEVSERLAVNIAGCLEEMLGIPSEQITLTPDWIRGVHARLAGELFPDWAGCFRLHELLAA